MALEDIAGYSLRRRLGSGSAGSVWLVRDLASGRNAVLKRVPCHSIPSAEEFREDLRILRRIDHPHLARLLEFRETATDWILISQHLVAGTLSDLLSRRGPLDTGELVTLLSPLAEAVDHLHRTGLAHGRVTPANVMFDADGRPVLTDTALHNQPHHATPADDLTALAALAHQAGGRPSVFTVDLFTRDRDLTRRILALADPAPINLAFPHPATDEPIASSRRPHPAANPPTTDDPPHLARTALPSLSPDNTADTPASSAPPPPPHKSIPRPTKPKPRSRSIRTRLTRRAAPPPTATNPLDRLNPSCPGATAPTSGGSGIVAGVSGGGSSRRGRRRRTFRRRTRFWKRLLVSRRHPGTSTPRQAPGRRRRFIHPAYGVLAAAGLAAVLVVVIGLVTVGVLDNKPTAPAAAADHTDPNAQPRSPTPAVPHTPAATPGVASQSPMDASRTSTSPGGPQSPGGGSVGADAGEWVRTLQALDARRAQAFWTLDFKALDQIYLPGSSPWSADRALIASYRKQQVRVRGLRVQIDSTTVEHRTATDITLRTVDHLSAGELLDPNGGRTPLPPGRPTTRLITLTTTPTHPTWRITAITSP